MRPTNLDADSTNILGRELHGKVVRYDVGLDGQLVAVLRDLCPVEHLFLVEVHLLDAGRQGNDRLALLFGNHDPARCRCGQRFAVIGGKRRRFVVDRPYIGQSGGHRLVVAGLADFDFALRPRHDDFLCHNPILLCG